MNRARIAAVTLSLAALCVVGYWIWSEEAADAGELEVGVDGKPVGERQRAELARERLRALARGAAASTKEVSVLEDPAFEPDEEEAKRPVNPPGTRVTLDEARVGFDYIMARVKKVARARKRIPQDQWQDLYRAANDAFSALSMHLDATDDAQATELEDAHRRLKQGLKRVRVRGEKFGSL